MSLGNVVVDGDWELQIVYLRRFGLNHGGSATVHSPSLLRLAAVTTHNLSDISLHITSVMGLVVP